MNESTVDEMIAKLEKIKAQTGNLPVFIKLPQTQKTVQEVKVEKDQWSDNNICVIS